MKQLVGAVRRAEVFGKETAADEARRRIDEDAQRTQEREVLAAVSASPHQTRPPPKVRRRET